MKRTHRDDLYCWSRFDPKRRLDFHGWLWQRRYGNVAIDPLPLEPHDLAHVEELGGISTVVITNSDHVRDAEDLAAKFRAELVGPRAERDGFPIPCHRWLGEGDTVVEGLEVLEMNGSKTPGELALLLEGTTLIAGDLLRAPFGGRLSMLPADKLADEHAALASVRRLEEFDGLDAILTGDGWPVFTGAQAALDALLRG